jgi:hypothetical protein
MSSPNLSLSNILVDCITDPANYKVLYNVKIIENHLEIKCWFNVLLV